MTQTRALTYDLPLKRICFLYIIKFESPKAICGRLYGLSSGSIILGIALRVSLATQVIFSLRPQED